MSETSTLTPDAARLGASAPGGGAPHGSDPHDDGPRPAARSGLSVGVRSALGSRAVLSFIALAALWLIAVLVSPSFGAPATTQYLLQTAAFLGIIALGQTLVIIMGGIDLSVSGVVALSAVVCAQIAEAGGPVAGVIVALIACAVVGTFNGAGVIFLGIPPIVMTLASGTILTGVLLIYTNGSPRSADIPLLRVIANDSIAGIPWAFLVWLAFAALTLWLLHGSGMGRYAFAAGSSATASRAAGVPMRATTLTMYTACAVLAGVSGLVLLGFTGTSSLTMGSPYQLLSIAAVVLGGTSILGGRGHLLGTVSGALLLTLLTSLLSAWDFSEAWRRVALGALILVLLLFYSRESKR
ncbi:ABC transporter permease [Glaciibacter psychrotolerans]|uniref:Ribose transport system permease protein n=1 Tax=Glaciibacter psychrotolerans TaxID=670054 RepID=A0A7Z0EI59_9MICO|nr:ABC transporter permease [Leifsonia psychrotolerans]NYJ21299.1 ribose transport system permease protein [Leifsonia psychrotolerans]